MERRERKTIRPKRRVKKAGVMDDQKKERVYKEASYQCGSISQNGVLCRVRQRDLTGLAGCLT